MPNTSASTGRRYSSAARAGSADRMGRGAGPGAVSAAGSGARGPAAVFASSSATLPCSPWAISTWSRPLETAASKAASPALVGNARSPARRTIRACAASSMSIRIPPSAHSDHSRDSVCPERLPSSRRASRQAAKWSRNRLA
ncbi:hypothetical protein GCM10027521_49260 [Amycolatopsis cihanbeyliensis]